MLRAFFRRLPLAASLVVLMSISLSSGVPTASARSQTASPGCGQDQYKYQHCFVALNVTAPPLDASSGVSNLGISSDMQIFNPFVANRDLESLAQMTNGGCYPDCTSPGHQIFAIEFGWIVAPNQTWTYPDGTAGSDYATHLFVNVRDSAKAAPDNNCLVHWTVTGWTCGWNSNYPGGSSDYPGKVLPTNTSQASVGHFVIVYSNGSWWLGYNNKWIGNVDGRWFGQDQSGNYLFSSVGPANWQGEVGVASNGATSQMGNGFCGTSLNKSANIYNMELAESGYTISARDPALYPSFTVSDPHRYNGYAYTPPGTTNSILSYGGPKGC